MVHLTAIVQMPVGEGTKIDVDIAVEEDTATEACEALANAIRLIELGGEWI
jgi:hypothetical protein